MLPDRVSNPGPLTYESGALPIALRGPAALALAKARGLSPVQADKPWYNYILKTYFLFIGCHNPVMQQSSETDISSKEKPNVRVVIT